MIKKGFNKERKRSRNQYVVLAPTLEENK